MENVESPTKPSPLNLSTRPSIERNVLKELNNLEGATKSPKQALATDQLDTRTKDPASFPNNLPDIVTNVHSDGNKAVNKKLLHVATPTDVQSSDEEYVDCNTTFKSNASLVNNTFDVTCDPNGIIENLNRTSNANVTVCLETNHSGLGDLETEKLIVNKLKKDDCLTENQSKDTTIREPEAASDPNCTVVVSHCVDELLVCERDNSNEASANGEFSVPVFVSELTNESDHVIEAHTVTEPKSAMESQTEIQQLPVFETETDLVIESTQVPKSNTVDYQFINLGAQLGSVASENVLQVDDLNSLNETRMVSSDGYSNCPAYSTFISNSNAINRTVLIESGSPNEEGYQLDTERQISATESKGLKDDSELNQQQKISEFKANQALSKDSLEPDSETRDCSLDSLEMKQIQNDEPSTPTDNCFSATSAEKIFSSRKAPNFSEMFPDASQASNGLNTLAKQWDASFVVEKTDLLNKPLRDNGQAPLMKDMLNTESCVPDFHFKPPHVPLSSGKQQGDPNNSSFMVLNSNDFDFLQSRGANSAGLEDDRRSSLLLRFDPLARRSILPTQFKSPVPVGGEEIGTDPNQTLTPTASSDQKTCDAHQTTNEPPSNGVLVEVTDTDMDNETNSYMNNVRIEKNGDKVISVDGVLLTNKKIDITSADENIRKKMEEYEATQEILLKRITEKDKAITKTSNVLELYEKAIAEALAAKEKLSQSYEKQHEELKTDRDVNFQHLLSLESTFADLHMKFERNVQYTAQLQDRLNAVSEEKSKAEDLLKQQEFRYDKMKSHTMQQFDIANTKLEQQTKTISLENTKLKAQIKRVEIHKNAVAEELSQKKKENEEVAKICDELISGQRS